ncbi:DUF523 and DUF1722 domain-containing protein [Geobacter sp. SVR]|uniref:YbgA family protein n=1 Tax=Geobacter sp. SVR TaxID=2495594 RepID=UPI00143EFD8A|nr:DUF523 and DUF1722 domain-containing protein [Geobacter sp. SVR]BCS54635.1 hypothetical protein GSVR_29430 [Geobacter sp. SVR]GCF86857.1 hypothetical protein GSbR_34570 [Geobacter sp. SVR]
MTEPIAIGVSSCLLGEKVRYNGEHKLDRYITETLGRFFSLVPVCPEVGCGLPIPREPMRLEGDPSAPRLMTISTRIDLTDRMTAFCETKLKELEQADLCGFIFKEGSPSSGLRRVGVYREQKRIAHGSGLFAAAFVRHFPLLPVEEEGRLSDPAVRENFIERVFCCRRWKNFLRQGCDRGGLVEFHADHKLLQMAHSPQLCREMGALVGQPGELEHGELFRRYETLLMRAMALPATVGKHTNVLMHIMGYFKRQLADREKAELLVAIEQYHQLTVPLIVPLTLLKHYAHTCGQQYLQRQVYLNPHPTELMLRNHA